MFKIIAVTNRKLCQNNFLEQIEMIAKTSVSAIILREKDLTETEYIKLAGDVLRICKKYSMECILHSHPEAARLYGQTAIHMPLPLLRMQYKELGKFTKIGTSVHSVEEAVEAEMLGATYLTAGHIFQTDCKKGLEPRGTVFLEDIINAVAIPVFAIGGISEYNLGEIRNAKASGACIMSEFMRAESPIHLQERLVNSTSCPEIHLLQRTRY